LDENGKLEGVFAAVRDGFLLEIDDLIKVL
jgi:hypothetical protein